jgi:hypothetical protein
VLVTHRPEDAAAAQVVVHLDAPGASSAGCQPSSANRTAMAPAPGTAPAEG